MKVAFRYSQNSEGTVSTLGFYDIRETLLHSFVIAAPYVAHVHDFLQQAQKAVAGILVAPITMMRTGCCVLSNRHICQTSDLVGNLIMHQPTIPAKHILNPPRCNQPSAVGIEAMSDRHLWFGCGALKSLVRMLGSRWCVSLRWVVPFMRRRPLDTRPLAP